jgi:hypothetical protein
MQFYLQTERTEVNIKFSMQIVFIVFTTAYTITKRNFENVSSGNYLHKWAILLTDYLPEVITSITI